MITYRIVPRRGAYNVEAVEPDGRWIVVSQWRTEEAAVSQLRDLELKTHRADYKPAPGEPGWRPR